MSGATAETAKPAETTTEAIKHPSPTAEVKTEEKVEVKAEDKSLVNKAEVPKPEPVAPLTLTDFKLPEGFEADAPLQEEFVGILNDATLSRAQLAQKLVDLQAKAVTTASERGSKEFADLQTKWKDEITADAEIGGAKLDGHLANISKMLDKFGTADARAAFDATGAGNNPHIVRMLAKVAALVNEPGPVSGQPGSMPKDPASILYPNQGKTK